MDPRCNTDGIRLLLAAKPTIVVHPEGSSMLPAFFPGDRVTLRAPGEVRVGEVVLTDGDRPRMHRVVSLDLDRGTLVTRGDALSSADPELDLDRVVAVVTTVQPDWPRRLRFVAARIRAALRRQGGRWVQRLTRERSR